ncbi:MULTISPECIES: protein-export chaperone SecB [unclassified Paenibacillus]|uniref:protein-export chaperone SecB n=1 Tax=unclassified Paenibacillus TaxID=185978 RepID=UPI00240496E8|nr:MULTISPECIES: protein-export chaperone SecB [unclassified Paenibacillus]MDF9844727.1 preprotein translocase subunit SecB [Paenibacillus sp. PastF-2]MDF9851329.1 preprotein translocase subunit SecB [Paenibacillus sp. PastM-2]MDF9857911.1 preprotein translocase subunit SecB [Paenibacillus sp. PastF-1]MDH6483178.1 preprotein translocase subunit SecB [Paenibacillus sp. PastH-2]MDH6510566.1 preprotein translocase subunit SecB [Paenibacillus sp. PastM-3]
MNKPVISFEKYEILSIDYKKLDEPSIEDANISTEVSIGISEQHEAGKVEIDVSISDPVNQREINVKVRGLFLIDESLEIEKIKQFLAQNGTAMLYPYVRSIVSMVSVLDSETSILLPTINTTK